MVSCDWRSRRQAIPSDHAYRCLIHDRSSIFSEDLDRDVKTFGVAVLKTPIRAPKANAYCERLIGTLRRECLDWFITNIDSRGLWGDLDEVLVHHRRAGGTGQKTNIPPEQ